MNRKCTPEDFRFLAAQYAVIPDELNKVAEEMERVGLEATEVEVTQLFNTYMEKVPRAAQSAAGAVRAKIEAYRQSEIRRAHLEGERQKNEAAATSERSVKPVKKGK